MFKVLRRKRAAYRAYQKRVDDCLAILFSGFPDSLSALRQEAGDSDLVWQGLNQGTDVRACSVQVAVLLTRRIIGPLSPRARQDLARAFLQNDANNPVYKGFKCLFQVAEQLHVSPALVSYLNTEVAGQLRGLSQQAIFNSWVDAQIDGVMGRLRERCFEEAELRQDVWQ